MYPILYILLSISSIIIVYVNHHYLYLTIIHLNITSLVSLLVIVIFYYYMKRTYYVVVIIIMMMIILLMLIMIIVRFSHNMLLR